MSFHVANAWEEENGRYVKVRDVASNDHGHEPWCVSMYLAAVSLNECNDMCLKIPM